ncbi:MAG: translation initiation factor [Myxococcota bacterium]
MSRKPKISTDGAPPLTDNPFAALQGSLGDLPEAELPTEPPTMPTSPTPPTSSAAAPFRGKIVIRREKKGRGGKTVTVIEGLGQPPEALADTAQQLRRNLGTGAHVEGTTIVVTGAQGQRIRDWLSSRGAHRVVLGN